MCLAVPGKILSIKGGNAEVDFSGVRRAVSLDLVPDARKNDYVLVHAGFAIQVLEPKEAQETLKVFAEVFGEDHGSAASGPLSHVKP
ncbi:MAG: HypC/HybG/HupF family hydrogenase formation chaperone [Elusimicrobia bacterium]|jgi:hydrogenase expression/formation protein HypC|nr:HypC/HybG/HupF family hydrogenase formation chaperone [Elusimicrobiota bacterium]